MKGNTTIIYALLAILVLAAIVLYLAGTSQDGGNTGRIAGTITYGPTYPGPCREGMDCSDKPFVGTVYVKDQGRSVTITQFNTDAAGSFDLELESGRYFLEVSQRFVSVCGKDVAVESGKVVNASFSCDTGMR